MNPNLYDQRPIKKARTDYAPSGLRTWSQTLDPCSKSCVLTMRAYFGAPNATLAYSIKSLNKPLLQSLMMSLGFTPQDCCNTKPALLELLQSRKPFVEFKIDAREGLQRVVGIPLRCWGYPQEFSFQASMPLRGGNMLGRKSLQQSDEFKDMFVLGMRPFKNDGEIDYYVREKIRNYDLKEDFVKDVAHGRLTGTDILPNRQVRGCSLKMNEGFQRTTDSENYRHDLIAGAVSIDAFDLECGDWIKFDCDIADNFAVHIQIASIEKDVPLLPESSNIVHRSGDQYWMANGEAVRAQIVFCDKTLPLVGP